jgi:hypothetical protein
VFLHAPGDIVGDPDIVSVVVAKTVDEILHDVRLVFRLYTTHRKYFWPILTRDVNEASSSEVSV